MITSGQWQWVTPPVARGLTIFISGGSVIAGDGIIVGWAPPHMSDFETETGTHLMFSGVLCSSVLDDDNHICAPRLRLEIGLSHVALVIYTPTCDPRTTCCTVAPSVRQQGNRLALILNPHGNFFVCLLVCACIEWIW